MAYEVHMTPSQYLGKLGEAYEARTGRADALDVIRDTLAKHHATRFSELRGDPLVKCVAEIADIFENGS